MDKIKSILFYLLFELPLVRQAIERAVIGYLRGKAKKTTNSIDDSLVDALEKALKNEAWKTLLARGKKK